MPFSQIQRNVGPNGPQQQNRRLMHSVGFKESTDYRPDHESRQSVDVGFAGYIDGAFPAEVLTQSSSSAKSYRSVRGCRSGRT